MSDGRYSWQLGASPPPLDDHSAAKHAVLRQYAATYVEVLTANPRREVLKLTIVDGFAGGGQYTRGGIIVPGSPLIALDELVAVEARVNAERTKPIRIDSEFIFVDRKKQNVEFLSATIKASPHAPLVGNRLSIIHDIFENALPSIIARIKSRGRADRAIFFLDQYGYSDVSLQTIRTILEQLVNPEIILTFNVDWLIDYLSTEESFLKAVKPVELSLTDLQQMLHLKGQREARWLIQNLLYKHLVKHTGAPYYTPFFVKSVESHRAYWLVHISKHPTARDEMTALHWRMQNHFVHHGRAGLRMLGYDPEQPIDQTPFDFIFDDNAQARSKKALMEELPEKVLSAHKSGDPPPTLLDLFNSVCNETPATKRLLSNTIVDLRELKEFEILTSDGRPRPRTTSVDDTDRIVPAKMRDLFSPFTPGNR
jgi:three-Cys-motif partner protein